VRPLQITLISTRIGWTILWVPYGPGQIHICHVYTAKHY
jgi:hypothetical protein